MSDKHKYFCCREWGFGSNIVNYLRTAFFCYKNNYYLILQDRNNSIGPEFCLFSVINLPEFIHRTTITKTIPIYNFKSLFKFNLNTKYSLFDKLFFTFCYLIGFKSEFFIKNFNTDQIINSYFSENFNKNNINTISNLWDYSLETKKIFQKFEEELKCEDFVPDLSIQIRGGDKLGELKVKGQKISSINIYVDTCLNELKKMSIKYPKIYIMTDTNSYFQFIKSSLLETFPNSDIRSFVSPKQEGHIQSHFNDLDIKQKINLYYLFLFELDMLRKASIVIGSYNSNIFYLAFLIRNKVTNHFISVDTTFENSFL